MIERRCAPDAQIREDFVSLDEKLTRAQVAFFGRTLRDLIERVPKNTSAPRLKPTGWREWKLFHDAAYVCGFVCRDATDQIDWRGQTSVSEFMRWLERDPARIAELSLREVRQIIHFIIRSERWADAGGPKGGGAIWSLITSPLGDALAKRLGS